VDGHFPAGLEAFTLDGRLVGVPWYLGVGRLFCRRDLLKKYELRVPQTWEELATSARTVQDGERAAGHSEFCDLSRRQVQLALDQGKAVAQDLANRASEAGRLWTGRVS
jgi:maltose-binding protein MalE